MIKICRGKKGVYTLFPKIMPFEKHEKICDDDIDSLFMGLFRLLKVSVRQEVEKEYLSKIAKLEKELFLLNERMCQK